MQTLGIIGGLGPDSTMDYYRTLIDSWRARVTDGSNPAFLVNSVNTRQMMDYMSANRLSDVADWMVLEVGRLARAGAAFALISANTPHVVFPEIAKRAPIPMLSIVESAADAVQARGFTRVALLGTRYTMTGRFYPDVFERRGLTLVTPTGNDLQWVHDKYVNELLSGTFAADTREGMLGVIDRMNASADIQAVILGGTELPILLRGDGHNGIPFLDTTRIHVAAAIDRMLSGVPTS